MKLSRLVHATCIATFATASLAAPNVTAAAFEDSVARQHESFDFGWRFHPGGAVGADQPAFDDSGWRALDLPHDWSIEGPYDENAPAGGPGGYLPTGVGWYRKYFALPESARGKTVRLQFDGVYQHSTVWLNGQELGTRPYGYSSFQYELTPHLRYGHDVNVVAVRVDNSRQPNSRWYSGSGIYRHTWLTVVDALHVAPWGVHVTTPSIAADRAEVRVQVNLRNQTSVPRRAAITIAILAPDQTSMRETAPDESSLAIGAGESVTLARTITVRSPRLWDLATPNLYTARTQVVENGRTVDAVETTFGIRSIEYHVDRGFLLNGSPVKMKGMCLHHDGGAVGAAVPEAVLERRLRLLKEMGCNAVRCSHNPMAPEFYDLCDRLGLLVMDEAFDEWTIRKPQIQFGYSDHFEEWHERDLVDLIHRNRNHPSIVMWSAGNEIGEQRADNGPAVLQRLVEIIHREDPTRPVTAAMDNIFNQEGQAPIAFSGLLDIVGYNYGDRWGSRRETHYSDDRHLFPRRKFVGTEVTSARGVRGEYDFAPVLGGGFAQGRITPGYGPAGAAYLGGTLRAASLWRFTATHDYAIGDFAWTGFDYLGEARWPRKLATSGALDTCGFKKDAFYFYQSIWTDAPMVHLLPHWNWPERVGQPVPVVAYTNCAAVELFLNGRSLGVKAREFPAQGTTGGWNTYAAPQIRATTSDLQLVWDLNYEPGELHVVGYDRHGTTVAEERVRTAGPPVALQLEVDRNAIVADAREVAHVMVRAVDTEGVFVPTANHEIHFELTGPARIIGVDNGDPESHASYQGNTRALFAGMALALVQSRRETGTVRITAHADGLRSATTSIEMR